MTLMSLYQDLEHPGFPYIQTAQHLNQKDKDKHTSQFKFQEQGNILAQ